MSVIFQTKQSIISKEYLMKRRINCSGLWNLAGATESRGSDLATPGKIKLWVAKKI